MTGARAGLFFSDGKGGQNHEGLRSWRGRRVMVQSEKFVARDEGSQEGLDVVAGPAEALVQRVGRGSWLVEVPGVDSSEDVGEGGVIGCKAEMAEQHLLCGGVDNLVVSGGISRAGRDRGDEPIALPGVALEPDLSLQRGTGLVVDRWLCGRTIECGARLGWVEVFDVIHQHRPRQGVQAGDLVLQRPEEDRKSVV